VEIYVGVFFMHVASLICSVILLWKKQPPPPLKKKSYHRRNPASPCSICSSAMLRRKANMSNATTHSESEREINNDPLFLNVCNMWLIILKSRKVKWNFISRLVTRIQVHPDLRGNWIPEKHRVRKKEGNLILFSTQYVKIRKASTNGLYQRY
jgi:hypothetical protein